MSDTADLLRSTAALAIDYLDGVGDRPVGRPVAADRLRDALGRGPLPAAGEDPAQIVASLAAAVEPGLVASAGPRYFGFVVGGSLPAALAADWLTSAWDQNAFSYAASPAGSVVEETAGRWVRELLGLPPEASTGFTTGATVANVVGLAAARHAVLARAGWDVEERGLIGAPPIRVLAGDEVHASALQALRVVGLGTGTGALERVPVDGQGAMRADEAARMLRGTDGPGHRPGAGRQREHRGLRPAWRDRRRRHTASERGSTSTARSACGPPRRRATGTSLPGSRRPTRGPSTATSGSTCRMTAGSSRSAIGRRTTPRCA